MNRAGELAVDLGRTGYYPELVTDSVLTAVAGEDVLGFVLNDEPAFDQDQLHRHLTVVVLTPRRLVVSHTDEHPAGPNRPQTSATTATEAVPLSSIRSVVVQRTVSAPAEYAAGRSTAQEVVITVGWGAVNRIDLAPSACDDPQCEADHGLSGTSMSDDLTIRVSLAAEGEQRLRNALDFARQLSRATADAL